MAKKVDKPKSGSRRRPSPGSPRRLPAELDHPALSPYGHRARTHYAGRCPAEYHPRAAKSARTKTAPQRCQPPPPQQLPALRRPPHGHRPSRAGHPHRPGARHRIWCPADRCRPLIGEARKINCCFMLLTGGTSRPRRSSWRHALFQRTRQPHRRRRSCTPSPSRTLCSGSRQLQANHWLPACC